jgi:hypothetical protein
VKRRIQGGDGTIRTCGTSRSFCFQGSCVRPLCHVSSGSDPVSSGSDPELKTFLIPGLTPNRKLFLAPRRGIEPLTFGSTSRRSPTELTRQNNWRRVWGSNPRARFLELSLSRRAPLTARSTLRITGRGCTIRTCDLGVPNALLYQTELNPENGAAHTALSRRREGRRNGERLRCIEWTRLQGSNLRPQPS